MTFRRLAETYPLWSTPQTAFFNNVPTWRPFLNFLNVRYAIAVGREPGPGWKVIASDRNSQLFENANVLPRAYVPRQIRYERDRKAVLEGMAAESDFANRGWISVPDFESHDITNGPGTVVVRRDGQSAYDMDVTMDADGWVIVSDSNWPGWRAYVDGKRVGIMDANHAFIGIFVPKGRHRLRLMYRPESFTRGRNISAVTLLVLAFFGLRHRFKKPRAV
jgi:uncharacterized membrane protein YfhO